MIGNNLRNGAGVPVDFGGFQAISRYWRLVITKNHGAKNTSLHGIEFFGYDLRVAKLISQLKLTEYEEDIVQHVNFQLTMNYFLLFLFNL